MPCSGGRADIWALGRYGARSSHAQPGPWDTPCRGQGAAGWQRQSLSSSLLAVVAHFMLCNAAVESLGWPSVLTERDGTLQLKHNEGLNELQILHFHPILNCAACCCLCWLLSSTGNIIFNEYISCPGGPRQWQVEWSRTQHLSPKSGWSLILCPCLPFPPSTLYSPKPKSSCFKKWFCVVLFLFLFFPTHDLLLCKTSATFWLIPKHHWWCV